jgi:hypothetical protein
MAVVVVVVVVDDDEVDEDASDTDGALSSDTLLLSPSSFVMVARGFTAWCCKRVRQRHEGEIWDSEEE